jgi:hypothetical protein
MFRIAHAGYTACDRRALTGRRSIVVRDGYVGWLMREKHQLHQRPGTMAKESCMMLRALGPRKARVRRRMASSISLEAVARLAGGLGTATVLPSWQRLPSSSHWHARSARRRLDSPTWQFCQRREAC